MSAVNHILAAFVFIIVGLVLLQVVSTEQTTLTEFSKAKNESISLNKSGLDIWAPTVYTLQNVPENYATYEGCNLSSIVVTNSSQAAAFTVTTDYTVNVANGTMTFVNTSNTVETADNLSYITYSYCGDGYLTAGWNRSILQLVVGFFALGILGVGVALFFKVGREAGII